ncbi:MAG: 1,4-alpha-glucan branching protein domain-containing protein [Chthoniobacteraceae bacterium]
MVPGYFALILHAHLPYVRHPEHEEFLEEDWLFEAITETYLPLLDVLHGLADEGVTYRLAMSLTPTLAHMLRDPLLQSRYERYLERLLALAENEARRAESRAVERSIARFYVLRLLRVREWWTHRWKRDVVGAFAQLQERGLVEIIACAATHGYLPLMDRPESVRAQVTIGVDAYREMFHREPRGIWLPECAFVPGLERVLAAHDLRWFLLDAHGIMLGRPRPSRGIYAPVFTPRGVAAFGRDRESARQVWSASEGYPGEPAYRDFYRDVGWEIPVEDFRRFYPDGQRRFTGLKCHRITGSDPKEPYDRVAALQMAGRHAAHFLEARIRQLGRLRPVMPVPPVVTSPFDAELFGHWWFEGPEWLDAFLRDAARAPASIRLTTPGEYLAAYDTHQVVEPAASSWGDAGYNAVWLDPSNAWIYPLLHAAERRMVSIARSLAARPRLSAIEERAAAQLARELLLAQASDWAFLIRMGTGREYAESRTRDHLERFDRLHDQLHAGRIETPFLESCEQRDNIFPRLNWRLYA